MTLEETDKMIERWKERISPIQPDPPMPLSIAERAAILINMNRKPTVPEVLPLVNEYYQKDGNGVGGCLHVVLDDGNIETCFVEGCIEWARENKDEDGEKLAELLLKMSYTQRRKIYSCHS